MIDAIALSRTRTERGLSQRKFANMVGLNFQVIRRLEAGGNDGNLTLREYQRICTALGVHPAGLLLRSGDQGPAAGAIESREELSLGQAALLRRLQKGEDLRRTLTAQDRQTILPTLVKGGLVDVGAAGTLRLSTHPLTDLAHPELLT